MSAPVFDLGNAPIDLLNAFLAGYEAGVSWGLDEGYRRGYAACDAEIAGLQRRAVAIVHGLASVPPFGTRTERLARMERAAERIKAELAEASHARPVRWEVAS